MTIRRRFLVAPCAVLFMAMNLFAMSYVQSNSLDCGTVTSCSLAFASNNSAGDFIVVAVRVGALGRTVTVTDSENNTYTQRITQAQTTDGHQAYVIDALKIASGANTVTVSISGSAAILRFAIHEYRTLAPSAVFDQANSSSSNAVTSTALNSGNVTTTYPNELIFGVGTTANPNTFTAGTNYTVRQHFGAGGDKAATEDQIVVSSQGTYNATETSGTADLWTCVIVTYSDPLDFFKRRLD